jgi:hypothetical protein
MVANAQDRQARARTVTRRSGCWPSAGHGAWRLTGHPFRCEPEDLARRRACRHIGGYECGRGAARSWPRIMTSRPCWAWGRRLAAGWCRNIFAAAGPGQSCAGGAVSAILDESLLLFRSLGNRILELAVIAWWWIAGRSTSNEVAGQARGAEFL